MNLNKFRIKNMKYKIQNSIEKNYIKDECILIGIYKKQKTNQNSIIEKEITKYNFSGKKNTYLTIKNNKLKNIKDIVLIGCGKENINNKNKFIKIIKYSFNIIKNLNYQSIIFDVNNLYFINTYWKIYKIIRIFENKNYKFNKFKSKKEKYKKYDFKINFFINDKKENKNATKAIKNSLIISKGIQKTKDLSNTPPNICNSIYIYKNVKKQIKSKYINIYKLDKNKLQKLGMNAYLSVNKGSKNNPMMIIINYKKKHQDNNQPIVLVGKGITFDTGGISIKTSKNMYEMKYDMSGASVIYGIMYIISKLKLNINVIGILSCAENMIDKHSSRPGDIIKSLSNNTIEIINTDAEGRLLLCDTLTYVKKFNPKLVIDIATLTGSCLMTLGKKISGLLSNDKTLTKKLIKSGKEIQDYVWELPLFKEYNKYLKSNFADIKNCSEQSYAGTITSGCFLSKFTKSYKWAHIDIAGTAYNNKGSTGKPIELIIQFLINESKL